MKSKYHLIKKKIYVQSTDGSIFILNTFSNIIRLKLSLDTKSSFLWKSNESLVTKNYKIFFMKRFFKSQ
jgi:hypothetical protein